MIARSPQAIAMALPPEDPAFTNFKASEVACAFVVIYGRGAGRFAGPTCIPLAHALPERLGQWVFVVSWQGGGGGLGENGAEGWEGGGAGAEVGFRGESGWVGVGGVAATTVVWMASHAHALRNCRQSGTDLEDENEFFDKLARQRMGQTPHHRFLHFRI